MVLAPNSNDETLATLLSNLNVNFTANENVNETLVNLQLFLAKIPPETIYSTLTNNILESFIRTASTVTSGEPLDLCREILETVVSTIPPMHLVKRFHAEVLLALNSNSSMIKITFLRAIKRAFEADITTLDDIATTNAPILIAICRCLTDEDISVYQEAELTLTTVAKSPKGLSILFDSNLAIETLKQMINDKDSVKRFRMHDLTADLCQISPENLAFCVKAGLVSSLLSEIGSDDILSQLNALEILTRISSESKHCLEYLHEQGVMNNLHEMLSGSQQSPDSTFVFPAVMKLFGHLGRLYPKECCEKYPKFLQAVFQLVLNYQLLEVGQRLLAFDTLGLLVSTPEGKYVLSKYDNLMQRCMKCFGQCIREGPMEMRVRHLEALSDLLRLELQDQTPELLTLTESWFSWLDDLPTEILFGIFKQPFPGLHLASGEVFKRLSVQRWGQKKMFQQPGFSEYLFNRSTENTMEGRYVKYEIVDLLVKSPSTSETLDETVVQRLKQYQEQGPYYVQGQVDVAMDEG